MKQCAVAALASGIALTVLALAGCGQRGLHGILAQNQRPMANITQSPPTRLDPSTYFTEIRWSGFDPDGYIVGFRYAVDPPSQLGSDTVWVSTNANRHVFTFSADSIVGGLVPTGRRYHTFVVESVDDRGATSPPAHISFDATTIAPSVLITNPVPSGLLLRRVAPSFRVSWQGKDADGVNSSLPAQYRWRVFSESSTPSMAVIQQDPDTLLDLFGPDFAEWNQVPGTETSAQLNGYTPGQRYLFALVAFDEAGARSPVMSLFENLLQFDVEVTAAAGPRVTLQTDMLTYEFPSGGIILDSNSWPRTDFGAGWPISIRWSAVSPSGTPSFLARWAVDIGSVTDETPRTDENTDVHHWSRWSNVQTLHLPNLDPPPGVSSATYRFYVEVMDESDQLTLVGMLVTVVRPTYARELLIVDDTFLRPDSRAANGCAQPPAQAWPTAAELDTFLYAVGGVPWRCYPGGTLSSPGIFAGYDFDTLGAHFIRAENFTLPMLGRYRNIVWMVDGESATSFEGIFNTSSQPMPFLRYLSRSGTGNPLISWMQAGGRLWLMGGGVAYASLRDFSVLGDAQNVFRSDNGELGPERFVSRYAHWRSEVTTYRSFQARRSTRAVGGWPGAPDYSLLPTNLTQKTAGSDPVPPLRTAGQFYATLFYSEYLSQPNQIVEHLAGLPGDSLGAALDTLYETVGGQSGTGYPMMTVYHGNENSQVIFSGFPIWYFRRDQAIQLSDFVFQSMWGMNRRPVPR